MLSPAGKLLAGILPDRADRLVQAVPKLREEFFSEDSYQRIWALLVRYYDRSYDVIPSDTFINLIERRFKEPSRVLLYTETFASLSEISVTDAEFRWALGDIVDLYLKRRTGHVIATAAAILETGTEVDNTVLEGQQSAREYLSTSLADLEHSAIKDLVPEGDIRAEKAEILAEYLDAKTRGDQYGIRCGIDTIDSVTGGFAPGELVLVVAAAGAGKSQFCVQVAWWASVMEGKNVFFATTETVRDVIRRRVVARHSRHAKFGLADGLDSSRLRKGQLDPTGEAALNTVLEDYSATDSEYGKLWIAQMPSDGSVDYVVRRANEVAKSFPVDLVVIDYLMLLKTAVRRQSRREELNDILNQAKSLAVTFSDGLGVPVVSPWQVNREQYKLAKGSGMYDFSALAETSEAEKSADVVLTLFAEDNNRRDIKVQMLKNRDGSLPDAFRVDVDYRSSYFEDRQRVETSLEDLI